MKNHSFLLVIALLVVCALAGNSDASYKSFSSNPAIQNLTLPVSTASGGSGTTTANAALRQFGGAPNWQLVGTRTSMNGIAGIWSGNGVQQKTQHTLPEGALDVSVCYAGWYGAYDGTTPSENAITPASPGTAFQAVSAAPVAGGTGYVVGDTVVPSVAANNFAPTLMVMAVSTGAVTQLGVVKGGMFNAIPATALAQNTTSGVGTGLTVNLGTVPFAMGLHVGIEQAWGTQTAISATNTTGVIRSRLGADFGGNDFEVFIPTGASMVCTDPLSLNLAAGSLIGIRAYTPAGNWWTAHIFDNQGTVDAFNAGAFTDISTGGAFSSANGTRAFMPVAIMGHVATPSATFVGIGDSIMYGADNSGAGVDPGDSAGNMGWLERGIGQNYPWSNISLNGDRMNKWVDGVSARMRLDTIRLMHPSHVVIGLGINDFSAAGTSYATFKTQFQYLVTELKGIDPGVQIWTATVTPYVTCSPDCTTQGNQTVTASNTARQLWNADLRNAAVYPTYGINKVLDVDASMEVGTTGKWVTSPSPLTTDGLHPDNAGYALLDTAISPLFVSVPLP